MSSPKKDDLCHTVRQTLTTEGREALRDDEAAQEHLAECDDCLALLEAQVELEALLPVLPAMDAPDELVQRVLLSVEKDSLGTDGHQPAEVPKWSFLSLEAWSPTLVGHRRMVAVGVTLVFAVVVGLSVFQASGPAFEESASVFQERAVRFTPPEIESSGQSPRSDDQLNELKSLGYLDAKAEDGAARVPAAPAPSGGRFLAKQKKEAEIELDALNARIARENQFSGSVRFEDEKSDEETEGGEKGEFVDGIREIVVTSEALQAEFQASYGPFDGPSTASQEARKDADLRQQEMNGDEAAGLSREAQEFLAERNRVEGLSFRDADGYWANTYLPGDPVLRLLQSSLESVPGGIHEDARQPIQPFDQPSNAALAVYLHADRASLEGESRTLLQVGLQGTERRSGQRPVMSLAVVLDLTDLDAGSQATAAALRALVLALGESRAAGDRFHLVVAGRSGGVLVEPKDFRHGQLLVTLDQLFSAGGGMAPTLDLPAAVAVAVERVREGDDPNAPLGSNVVILVTPRSLGTATATITSLAHRSALEGVLVSTVGVGDGVDRGELDRIALAGQGSRRELRDSAEAAGLVERELASASRAVARAVRVRIRLAPGVRLVDVLGSRRLSARQAEEVREAEQGVDLQLAQRMSIAADRGEDEEGVQIVIPSFYAGDSHVILLDVVAPGPGALADVTVRYKDLVYLRNGVARDQLSLPRGQEASGPLELNVLKNLIAYRLHEALEESGAFAKAGQIEPARQRLGECAALLGGLRAEVPGLAQDRELAADQTLLERYRSALGLGGASATVALRALADSLRLAARLKILPRPLRTDE